MGQEFLSAHRMDIVKLLGESPPTGFTFISWEPPLIVKPDPGYLHHTTPPLVMMSLWTPFEFKALNGTVRWRLPLSKVNVWSGLPSLDPPRPLVMRTRVSRGRIPITVYLMVLHEFGSPWTRSTRTVWIYGKPRCTCSTPGFRVRRSERSCITICLGYPRD